MISSENSGQKKGSFLVFFEKRVYPAIPYSIRFSAGVECIRDIHVSEIIWKNRKFKCETYTNQQMDMAEEYLGIKLNDQSHEVVKVLSWWHNRH